MNSSSKYLLKCFLIILLATGCTKEDEWLEVKSQKSFVVPETLADYQAMLDNNSRLRSRLPIAGNAGADNLFLTETAFSRLSQVQRNLYTWEKLVWDNQRSVDWENSYAIIEYANVVIDGVGNVKGASDAQKNYVLGQALFLRSFVFYHLAQLFCKPYNPSTATLDKGLPLRLSPDVNIIYKRSSVEDTYNRIISDAERAKGLLPNFSTIFRASLPATNTLLSKVYFVMGKYTEASGYATKALEQFSAILDFNSDIINKNSTYRFPTSGRNNPEIIYYSEGTGYSIATPSTSSPAYADTLLIKQYNENDLRKEILFNPDPATGYRKFRGGYSGSNLVFCGLATNELYLIKAECNARQGKFSEAVQDLNLLLVKRYKTGTFTPFATEGLSNVVQLILIERRKELPFTANIRWEDLRRLNLEGEYPITIKRNINNKQYTLVPNDKRYVLPIPENETQISGLEQNER